MTKIVADNMASAASGSSMIRKMFEKGLELKRRFGEDKVYDFSIGNPDLPTPAGVADVMRKMAEDSVKPMAFGYCPNAGIPAVRERLAELVSREQGTKVSGANLILTTGAAGGIVTFFRTVLNSGDEVVCPSPYFVEYGAYCGHFGGKLVPVPMKPPRFDLDVKAILAAVNENTRVILVNTPNNPTGVIYKAADLKKLGAAVTKLNAKRERPIFILSDEPYRALRYDRRKVAPMFPVCDCTVVVGSFSKTLSLAGERIGYIAINPAMPDGDKLAAALTVAFRSLGFVNAPVVGQRIAAALCDQAVDVKIYQARRDAMAEILAASGLKFSLPEGAFYFFVEAPKGDEMALVNALQKQNVLVVPGSGFGLKGYVRIAFCVSEKIIRASAPAFKRASKSWAK